MPTRGAWTLATSPPRLVMLRVRSIYLATQKRPQERLQGRSASPLWGGITHGQFDQISAFFAVSERVFSCRICNLNLRRILGRLLSLAFGRFKNVNQCTA